ncbi:MAG: SDR family NAD(P)-dependent oxidoreductase [Flavobacteriaceae bacterium]
MKILLTGASRGIGRATALRLAKKGVGLALCGSAHGDELNEVVAAARAKGADVHGLLGNLADPDVPARLVSEAVEKLGGLDSVVANAGISSPAMLKDLALEDWQRVFDVNVRSVWLLAKAAHDHITAARGAMVIISSMSGLQPYSGMGPYSASKAASAMLGRQLAQEWAATGARVNVIAPGLFESAMTRAVYADPEKKRAREALVPIHRIGQPEPEIAGLVEYLLGPDSTYMTGAVLTVDGGLLDSIQSNIAGRPATEK